MAEHPTTVSVEALQRHTYHGRRHEVGDVYDVDAQDVETVEVQGKAKRVSNRGAYKTTAVDNRRTTALQAGPPAGTKASAATPVTATKTKR